MNVEISWRAVAIVGLLAVLGVVCSLLGEKTLGASLVGGALGYLAQGFAHGAPTNGSGKVLEALTEISEKLPGPRPPTAARVQLVPLTVSLICLYGLMLACLR